MTGRGVDQILPHPSDPRLYESFVPSARQYVDLAERASGRIQRPVDYAYVWGDALAELEARAPDVRIVNLETAVTTSDDAWPDKGIHYRMHPANVPCLGALRVDCCVLANNHVMDWGERGLLETLRSLDSADIRTAGAGRDAAAAARPAALALPGGRRVVVHAFALRSSGVPAAWRALPGRPGVNLLPDLSRRSLREVATAVAAHRREGDLTLVSLHWGPNWSFDIPREDRQFAHALIDEAGADLVHGHSSHHVKGIEVHRGRLILYGCGDLLTDYEGIGGHESWHGELSLLYLPVLDARTGELRELVMVPLRLHRLRLTRAQPAELAWLRETLLREGRALGTGVTVDADGALRLTWS